MSLALRISNKVLSAYAQLGGKTGVRKMEDTLSADYKTVREAALLDGSDAATYCTMLMAALYARPHILRTAATDLVAPETAFYATVVDETPVPKGWSMPDYATAMRNNAKLTEVLLKLNLQGRFHSIQDPITYVASVAALLIRLR